MTKWNVVYNTIIAGTVSQEKVDQYRKFVTENPNCFEGIWNIELTKDSPDEDFAKVLMLQHETLEEEALDMEIVDVCKLD